MKQLVDRWAEIDAGLRAMEESVVQVGWFDEDAATVALINDRGGNRGDNPPPRPVLGPGLDLARDDVRRALSRGVSDVLRGEGPTAAADALERAGVILEQGVRDVMDAVAPPNAASTVAQKRGYSAPLRGFAPDRLWTRLEHRVVPASDAAGDDAEDLGY